MDRFTVAPFLVVFFAGLLSLPALNVFKICAWDAGTMKVDPWRIRSARAVQKVSQTLRAWFSGLFTRRGMAFACLAVLIALLAMQLSAAHGHAHQVLTATVLPIATMRANRATLVTEADALKKDGKFENDAARAAFDEKMTKVEELDVEIRAAESIERTKASDVNVDEVRQQAVSAERKRVKDIRDAVRVAKLDTAFAEPLITEGKSIEDARAAIFSEMATRSNKNPSNSRFEMGEDAKEKFLRGATNWLLVKGGVAALVARAEKVDLATIDPGEFRGMSLLDLARETLERAGRSMRGMDKMRLIGEALTHRSDVTQSTSDFAILLENTMHKVLQLAYAITPDTWSLWCNSSTVSDFRAHNRYRMGSFGALDALNEVGEFKNKSIVDGEKATITATTKGNIINVSRQMIVNDDMNAFARLPELLGRAAKLSVEVDAYALLLLNSGLGPTQSDSQPLFHSNRSNVGTGAALSAASLDADAALMAAQKDPNGNEYLALEPAVLLVPRGLKGQALVINDSQYDPDTLANKSQMKPNVARGFFRTIVGTPRLAGTRRYAFSDPTLYPVFEVAFLEGQTSPVLETQDGWRVDGAEMKVRFDYGVAAVDYRGATTNAGA